ncbi:MAG: DNA polymerase I [Lachnospiraceae bacterium]|nr:DNA polymerase I [Lachnospiraceae bacterium]
MMRKLLLIDGHSMLNRAFYGIPTLTNSAGVPTNAVYGFLNIMFKVLDEEQPDLLAVAFDVKAPTFRHKMYAEYKGTRKPMPAELHQQVPIMKEVLAAMGITTLECPGFEADDILGTVSKAAEKEGMEVAILSGDRDLLQLATDRIMIRIPKTSKGVTQVFNYHTRDVVDQYGITPAQVIELKGLMGDSSDNIPGLPGVGEKTALKILTDYGSIEEAFAHVSEIKPPKAAKAMEEHIDLARLSKELATINTAADISFDLESMKMGSLYTQEAYVLFKRLEFKNLLGRFESDTAKGAAKNAADFVLVNDRDGVGDVFDKAMKADTVGLDLFSEEGIRGGALCHDGKTAYVFVETETLPFEDILSGFKRVISGAGKVAFANLKKVLKFCPDLEFDERYADVSIGGYLLNPLKDNYAYDDIGGEYLGVVLTSRKEKLGKTPLAEAYKSDREDFLYVTAYPAFVAAASLEVICNRLREEGMYKLYTDLEMPLIFTLDSMERYGIAVKRDELRTYGAQLSGRIAELEKAIYDQAGEEFNINSPKQLGVILFEKMNLPGGKKTKTGYSTAADVLEKLAEKNHIVSDILEYRQLTKLKSTYADGLDEFIGEDGRIHSNFNQTITATGRISSTEPNLQNIPVRMELGRLIRKVFVPEEGFIFIDADYSQIELRVLAHMSGDESLIKAYREEADIHAITASEVFHVSISEVTPLMRRNAKAVNFGIVYGISTFGLSRDLSITRKEAAEYIERYYETYPGIKAALTGMVDSAKKNGYSVTLWGRKRPIPELGSGNFMQRSFGERVAMNAPIQGTAADIIKIAMIDVDREIKKRGLKSRLILQVHDELLIEAHKSEKDEVISILKEKMMGAATLAVPLEIQVSEGNNWYEAK